MVAFPIYVPVAYVKVAKTGIFDKGTENIQQFQKCTISI